MKVSYSKNFLKQYTNLSPNIQKRTDERLLIWSTNPLDPLLRNHSLKGKCSKYRSIKITGDYRALYVQTGKELIFDAIGTHSQLY
jgi:addiction module RelE/StbE family toxin